MIVGLPSLTAMYIANARAIASSDVELSRVCSDPFATRLLPAPLRLAALAAAAMPVAARALRYASFGMLDHVALRTALIDAQVRASWEAGVRQLVLLGAGLDARAHRLGELADAVVFEVDHASTQAYKRSHARNWTSARRDVRYVAVDLQTESCEAPLRAAGFDPTRPSCVVWEGVTMYLSPVAVKRTVAALSRISAPSSSVVATYLAGSAADRSALWRTNKALLSLIAEPLGFTSDPEAIASLFAEHGFRMQSDVQPLSQARALGIRLAGRPVGPAERERVVVAVRTAQ